MKTVEFENNNDWLEARKGKITGTKLKNIIVKRGNGKKVGFYELIAERMTVDDGITLDPMNRGTHLEPDALEIFAEETGKVIDNRKLMWVHDKYPNIACSPDGVVVDEPAVVEVKCLGSARHVEAYLTGKIPNDYMEQAIQPFIVNEKLKTLYFVYFDPRMIAKDFFFHTLERKDIKQEIKDYKKYQIDTLKEVDDIVADLTDF